jgi:molybdate transport system regulatory protein
MVAAQTKFRLRVFRDRMPAIGPGKIDLLEAIDRAGSITSAAKSLGMSYNRAWHLVAELNEVLVKPAVEGNKGGADGGGSAITDAGLTLIREYRAVEREAEAATAKRLKGLKKMVKPG